MHEPFYQKFQAFVSKMHPDLAIKGLEFKSSFVSPFKIKLSETDFKTCLHSIHSLTKLRNTPSYQSFIEKHLEDSHPELKPFRPNQKSLFMGYDFHLSPEGPKLIEVNTNAGFGLGLDVLYRFRSEILGESIDPRVFPKDLRNQIKKDFLNEWEISEAGTAEASRNIQPSQLHASICDDQIDKQALAFEFELFKQLMNEIFASSSVIECRDLHFKNGTLVNTKQEGISFLYNRSTDFYWKNPSSEGIRTAWQQLANLTISPNPFDFSLMADKSCMLNFCNADFLRQHSLSETDIHQILAVALQTILVTPENAETIHKDRKRYFFKPFESFGGKAVYNGKSISSKVWAEILQHPYLAQETCPAAEVSVETAPESVTNYKFDIRFYMYGDELRTLGARIYQGQTTNFRSPWGGFAGVEIVS
jgi:hypothetical protein